MCSNAVANIETGERRIDLTEFIWFVKACDADPLQMFENVLEEIGDTKPSRPKRAK